MAEFPHMPLATDAYIADTKHLRPMEHGVYLMLLIVAWRRRGRPCLENVDRMLARYAGVDMRTWKAIKSTIMAFWDLGADGFWTQKKQLEVRELANKRAAQAKEKAQRRWGAKPLKDNDGTDAAAMPKPYHDDAIHNHALLREIKEPNGSLSETGVSDPLAKKGSRKVYPADFEAAWKAYPTDKLMSKKKAAAAWAKLDAGERQRTFAAIPGFIAYCKAHPTYRPVHMVRFITEARADGFLEAQMVVTEADWQTRLAFGRKHRRWGTETWGPAPGQPACQIPAHLLQPGDGVGWSEWKRPSTTN